MVTPDRIEKLLAQSVVTGIDFIYIHASQVWVDVYFLRDPSTINVPLTTGLPDENIKIYSPSGAAAPIAATSLGLVNVNGRQVLRLLAAQPGNFSLYNLLIDDDRIDPYFNDVPFSFKANCPSDLDCKPAPHDCPVEEQVDFPIDYTARDFWSYRRALLDFASLRYPNWPDRLAADAGVMLAEVMSAAGDEMAYYQDRIAREAYLETATQRRSLRRHAKLVDYHIYDSFGAFAWMDITVKPAMNGNIFAGTSIWALSENGIRTDFEIGNNLKETITKVPYAVNSLFNEFTAYRWDEDQLCLPVGSTELYVEGHHSSHLLNFAGFAPTAEEGKWVLLKTASVNPAQPVRRFMVMLVEVKDMMDPVFLTPITYLKWDDKQALPFEMDMTELVVRGNMLPATSGKTFRQYFITGASLADLTPAEQAQLLADADSDKATIMQAVEREGINESVTYLCTLHQSEEINIVCVGKDTGHSEPEIYLDELKFSTPNWIVKKHWNWQPSLVGSNSSESGDTDYTLDDGSWRRVTAYWRKGREIVHNDYASGNGTTIRFGNGEFGLIPSEKSVFKVHYRLGGGNASNVAADTIKEFDKAAMVFVEKISNQLVAANGKDGEALNHIRQSAPQAFRTITYRAVKPEDYAEAAERLQWVQKAGAVFRWTGSWHTAFVTPDPKNAVALSDEWKEDIFHQLNRFRQAGREAFSLDPQYADLDIEIEICASPYAYPGELKERIMIQLFGKKGVLPVTGFFSANRFSFGDMLERSQLEAAIQQVDGVKAVEGIRFRRRGYFSWKTFSEYFYDPGKDSIIRVENDPLHPERGTLKIYIHGGA